MKTKSSTNEPSDIRKNCPAVRVPMFPRDTNGTGRNIHGGVILRHMDEAGAIAARAQTDKRVVTVSFDKVVFKKPVLIGDVLTCWAEVTRIGRSSITTKIIVEAERHGEFIPVTEGEAVYVAVDENDRPIPIGDGDGELGVPAHSSSACTRCKHEPASAPDVESTSTSGSRSKSNRDRKRKRPKSNRR